jgi:hypothetical protein
MKWYCVSHLSNSALVEEARAGLRKENTEAIRTLPHLAEIDARELYAPAGYSSMYQYCVDELGLCPHAGLNRINAARVARRFPEIFECLADGRLHLSAVLLLAPKLTDETPAELARELIAAASHRSKSEIARMLAERFPRADVPTRLEAVGMTGLDLPTGHSTDQLPPGGVESAVERPKVKHLAPQKFSLQVTIDQETHDDLRQAQALLHRGAKDVAEILKAALRAYVGQLEKRKFGATDRPRPARPAKAGSRDIPAHIRRTVHQRDGGRCAFVGDRGHRCESRGVEFDHIVPVAKGGETSVANLRLLCRKHNQYVAERMFGAGFMQRKREAAAAARAEARAERAPTEPDLPPHVEEVVPWLVGLRLRESEARRVAAFCAQMPEASLEERVRYAISNYRPR